MLAGFHAIPRATQPVRTNLIGPESRVVTVLSENGQPLELTVELTAMTQTRSLFAVETPYVEVANARVRVVDPSPAPADLNIELCFVDHRTVFTGSPARR